MIRSIRTVALLILLLCSSAYAWSTKEHILITRSAVRLLLEDPKTPDEMKRWLVEAQPQLGSWEGEFDFLMHVRMGVVPRGVDGLAYWSVMPDMVGDSASGKERKVVPFAVPEPLLHYIDLEYFMANEADRVYAPDLSHRPKVEEISRDMEDVRWQKAGMLPFRLDHVYGELVEKIRRGRLLDRPGEFPRDEHATKAAGYIAHYAADNWMPYHATADYQAYSYFPEFEKKPRVHFDMEFRLTDHDEADYPELRAEFWHLYRQALKQGIMDAEDDLWMQSVQTAHRSYEALPLLGQAARRAYIAADGKLKDFDTNVFFGHRGEVDGESRTVLEIKARAMANSARWIAGLWLAAWTDAHQNASAN